jgi:hypothetical protein
MSISTNQLGLLLHHLAVDQWKWPAFDPARVGEAVEHIKDESVPEDD